MMSIRTFLSNAAAGAALATAGCGCQGEPDRALTTMKVPGVPSNDASNGVRKFVGGSDLDGLPRAELETRFKSAEASILGRARKFDGTTTLDGVIEGSGEPPVSFHYVNGPNAHWVMLKQDLPQSEGSSFRAVCEFKKDGSMEYSEARTKVTVLGHEGDDEFPVTDMSVTPYMRSADPNQVLARGVKIFESIRASLDRDEKVHLENMAEISKLAEALQGAKVFKGVYIEDRRIEELSRFNGYSGARDVQLDFSRPDRYIVRVVSFPRDPADSTARLVEYNLAKDGKSGFIDQTWFHKNEPVPANVKESEFPASKDPRYVSGQMRYLVEKIARER